ncbi:TPT1 [Mytilus edulis]|uniref:2'-phosphotransferase n=1 Tax=Mytilus edulis TaxID=6550 RepID=A0A8S3RM73_MYTED|nr:TPT1 [Mytilus edulis]
MEKRQQSIPKKEIECLKGKFVTSEKNSSEKHLTTEGLGPSSSDVKIISKKSDQCSKNEHIEKPVLSRVDAVNQYRDDIIKKTSALTSGILPEKHFEDNESSDDSVDGGNSVCINRVESAVIQTSVRINDYELKAVIDTGAEVTVLSEKVYRNLAKEHHLELKTATRGLLVAEEGKKMSATGITEIEMSLGPLRFTWPVYVAPLNDDLLLGCDIIDEMDITVNTKRGFQIKDIWYPCEVKRRESIRLLKYNSGQRADANQQGGSLKEEGNSYQRSDKGRARGGKGHYNRGSNRQGNQWNNQGNYSGQYNRGNDRQVNQANNRDNYRQENRQHNQEERPQRTEFDQTLNNQKPNVKHLDDMTEAQSYINSNDRARPKDNNHDDHMRDSSSDRQDRLRPKDKKDHTWDPSPDKSLPKHCIQYTIGSFTDAASKDQSNEVQSTTVEGPQGIDMDQQVLDNQTMEWDAQQDQGQFLYYTNQREQDYRPQHYNRGKGQQRQGFNEKLDNSLGQVRDPKHHRYNKRQYDYHNQDRGQQHQSNDDRRDIYDRGQRYQGFSNNNDSYQQDQGYNRRDRRQQRSWGEKSDIHLSKALSFILRHDAERQGYKMMPGGFLYVDEILKRQSNLRDYNHEDVKRIVETNGKKRFYMEPDKETGKMKIRANQGHSIDVEDLELKPLLNAKEVSMIIHGTSYNSWEKIKHTGLSRMGRNHIHFAAGELGENGVISGMRQSCEVMIFINLETALTDGFKFFRSANNVILCAGNEDGVIPPKYFVHVLAMRRQPKEEIT